MNIEDPIEADTKRKDKRMFNANQQKRKVL